MPQNAQNIYSAALIIIGNEILSGRTQDINTSWIAGKLTASGIHLVEVRVVPDLEDKIIAALDALRKTVDYVFTTGGIGPTHDDMTSETLAKAFAVPLERNGEAYKMLCAHYGEENITDARSKMAMIPKTAELIPNPVSGAPGFILGNVYVMAGVPSIMQAMFDYVLPALRGGAVVKSNTVESSLPESALAGYLAELQEAYPQVDIGSYPNFKKGDLGVSAVLRSSDEKALREASACLLAHFTEINHEPKALHFEVPLDDVL